MTLDMFDTIDGQHVVYSCEEPEQKFPVVSLLDANGEETSDPEKALGGVVQLGEKDFGVFWWSTVQ